MTGPVEMALRSVPPSWGAVRFKVALERREERNTNLHHEMMSLTSAGNVVPRSSLGDRQEPAEQNLPRYLVADVDDLIVNPMWLIGRAIGVSTVAGAVSPDYRVFRPKCHYPRFLHHLVRSDPYIDQYKLYTRAETTFDRRVQQDDLDNTILPVPPLEEQRRLGDFLDRETSKIDALIGKQEQLIATLREDRTSTITHAVTKGLDSDVEMAPSGFSGLPLVPVGWGVTPLKHVCVVRDCKHVTAEFVDDGFPLASIREVQSRYVDLADAKQTTEDFYKLLNEGGRRPTAGDLIFSRNATVGEVAEVPRSSVPFAMGQDVCLLRPQLTKVDSAYTWYTLRSGLVRTQIDVMMIGSTFKRINVEEIRSLVITLPPPVEQQAIVGFLDERCTKIDAVISKANDVIETMREYRSALITDAVTGKIDVRGSA